MNITQLNFLYWQNVHIWHFIKANRKICLLFVVVPTLISWIKTKILTDYNDKILDWYLVGFLYSRKSRKCLEESRNYMPPILVPSSAKSIATQILVIAKLNERKNFILRVFVCDIICPSKEFKVSNLSTRIKCESCSVSRMSMLTIFNIKDVNGVVLVFLLLTVNIFQTLL